MAASANLQAPSVSARAAQEQLARVAGSATFRGAGRLRRFLEFIVGEALAGRQEQIKEYVVGVAVFDKPDSFDPRTDPIVRVQARRLRALLERYYKEEAAAGELVLELPKGGYAPQIRPAEPAPQRSASAAPFASRNTVAVQVFSDDSPNRELAHFCLGLRQELIHALARSSPLRISASLDGAGAGLIVAGSVRRFGDSLRVMAHLVDGASGYYVWSESVDGAMDDMLRAQQETARLVAAKVEAEAGNVPGHDRRRQPENLAARNLYLQGRYHLNQRTEESLRKAAEFFERALREDPQYALAHSGLTDAYSLLGHYGVLAPAAVWTKVAAHATTAVLLDPNSVEALTSLAHVKASQDWDWEGAEAQYRQAFRLCPSHATAHHWFAMTCLVPTGRLQEALEEMHIAQSLDPVSAIIARDLAWIHYYRREYDLALEQCDHAIELNPHFSAAFATLGCIQEQRRDFEEAHAAYQRALHLSPASPRAHAGLGHMYALLGKRKQCLETLEKLRLLALTRYVSPIEMATLNFGLGNQDEAFEWLTKASQDRCIEMLGLQVDPRFDAARRDPRFAQVTRAVAHPPTHPLPHPEPRPAKPARKSKRAS